MSGWKLPGYVVETLLGFGASGEVWRARVASTGEAVALKRIAIGDAAQARSAQAEAALLATLDHPHLVRLHELVPTSDAVVLVIDLAAGGTLAELVAARGRITPGEAITALAPVGAALAYAHTAGVVHGDVTPANVLFTEAGMPLLADLGVARLRGDDGPAHSTPAFIDPAVAAGCVPGPQSDVFMLGAVLLHALTGRPMWADDTAAHALAAAAAAGPEDVEARLAELPVSVPEPVLAVLARALSIEPALRGSAAEFALDLRHADTPLAVELSAGRERSEPIQPAPTGGADGGAETASGAEATASDALSFDAARPPFDRPAAAAVAPRLPVLTHTVRGRPRPVPTRRTRRTLRGAMRSRWVAGAAGLLVVIVAAGVIWTVLSDRGPADGSAAPPGTPAGAPVEAPAGASPGTSTGAPAGASHVDGSEGRPLTAGRVSAVLAGLDARRQQAFATRDPDLLGRVYLPGPLLDQDAALLKRIVPAGCRLLGARTSYRDVRLTGRDSGRIEAAATATLAGSSLSCRGSAAGRAPGIGPSELHIVLAPHGGDYLIAAIHR